MAKKKIKVDQKYFEWVHTQFFSPGDVTEIRVIGVSGKHPAWDGWARNIVNGFFDNAVDFGKTAQALSKAEFVGIYFTPNPVNPALLNRAVNRMKCGQKNLSTSDHDIQALRWLLIDLDAVRPAGISSTNAELAQAIKRRDEIFDYLSSTYDENKTTMIKARSGNGAHLMSKFDDLENTPENVLEIKLILEGLSAKFSDDQVHVDTSVFNPSRIWKLYGTMARKGDHTPDRPHRRSYIERQ